MLKPDLIPAELRKLPQWVVWRSEERDGKPTKVPYQTTGVEAKVNAAFTWSEFEMALACARDYDGIGFVFSEHDPYCGIDLDGCRDPLTLKTQPWAVQWLEAMGSYCEVSPSQSGWKIWCRGKSKFDKGRKKSLSGETLGGKNPGVEIYDHVRWFAMTGLRGKYKEVVECQGQIDQFCDHYWSVGPLPYYATTLADTEVNDRAERYVAAMPPAISGQSGHNSAFRVACVLVLGFGMTPEQAFPAYNGYNARCVPPWSEKEIWHKLNSANAQPGERFYLRNIREDQWATYKVPEYSDPSAPAVAAASPTGGTVITFSDLESAAKRYLDVLEDGDPLIDIGIPELSAALGGGVQRGEMVILAARPSHGKSAFALQCLHNCAENDLECLMVSEEMSSIALGKRTLQYATGVIEERWKCDRKIVERHLDAHFRKRKPIHLVESCRTPAVVDQAIRQAVEQHGVQVVAVDYAQMLIGAGKGRYEQISNTSLALRKIANDHNVLLLVLAQLNREVEGRVKFVPKMTDLRDSGQLEQDADVIFFLVWPYRLDQSKDKHEYQIYVAKNRNRAINQFALTCHFDPTRQRFEELPVIRHAEFASYAPDAAAGRDEF